MVKECETLKSDKNKTREELAKVQQERKTIQQNNNTLSQKLKDLSDKWEELSQAKLKITTERNDAIQVIMHVFFCLDVGLRFWVIPCHVYDNPILFLLFSLLCVSKTFHCTLYCCIRPSFEERSVLDVHARKQTANIFFIVTHKLRIGLLFFVELTIFIAL